MTSSALTTRTTRRIHTTTRARRAALAVAVAVATLAAIATGCADARINPTFPITREVARAEVRAMADHPIPLARPVVVLTGYLDPGISSRTIAEVVRGTTGDERVIEVSFGFEWEFDACRRKVIERVDRAFGSSGDPDWTVEVDVVAFSMGGLVARYAAARSRDPEEGPRRLRIARLFTVCTPHLGAKSAVLPSFHPLHLEMRAGSDFLVHLERERADATWRLYPYARLGDPVVGEENSAPPGDVAWWVDSWWLPAHFWATSDERILADIARHLRGELGYGVVPRAPLPD